MFKKSDVKDIYSLTPMQEGMLVHYQLDTTRNSYFEQAVVSLKGAIDVSLFRQAFHLLVQKHDVLRTVFLYSNVKKPVQVVLKKRVANIEYSDISCLNNGRSEDYIEDFLAQDRTRGFDLQKDMLLRLALIQVSPQSWKAVWTSHHLIMDGWCLGLLFSDFIGLYHTLATKGQVDSKTGIPFSRYVKWLEGRNLDEGLRFWKRQLTGYEGQVDFPTKHLKIDRQDYQTAEYVFEIGEQISTPLSQLAQSYNVTLSIIFQCILGILLQRFNNTNDAVFGNVVSGRPPEIDGVEEIIGLFVNTVPVRIRSESGDTFGQLIKLVHRKSGEAKPHEYVPLAEIQALSSLKRELIRVVFGFQNYPMAQQMQDACQDESTGISIEDIQGFEQIGNDFNCIVSPGQRINIRFNYNANVYEEGMVRRIARSFQAVAIHVARKPESRILSIPVITVEEAADLARKWNETEKGYDLEQPIHHLIKKQLEGNSHRVAVVGQSLRNVDTRGGSLNQLTYDSLWRKAGELATYLQNEAKLRIQEPVAILLDPFVERIAVMLGILRAGGAFVPIDPALPSNRIRFMIRDAAIRVVISQKKFVALLNRLQWECSPFESYLCLDSEDIYNETEMRHNRLMDKALWEYVGETAVDHITGGGWQSSFTGEPFSKEEMDEYGENVRKKLEPSLKKEMRILDIGCASGITMFRLAPNVALYYGVDLSQTIIDWNRGEAERRGLDNIRLACMAAHEIEGLDEDDFDLIIINSVIQCFHGHNYLRQVVGMCIDKLKENGRIFIGDVMDQDSKEELLADLRRFVRERPEYRGKTKTDFSNELFLSRRFFDDLAFQYPMIHSIQHSEKIFTIENELTRYRYDITLSIDRSRKSSTESLDVCKRQHDIRFLKQRHEPYSDPIVSSGNLAYVIYTSGSTGRPKGVMVEHRSLVNLCLWHEKCFDVTHRDHATQYAGFGFDAAVWEVFPYLNKGAALFVISDDLKLELGKLKSYFELYDITVGFLPTQFCEQFQEVENRSLRAMLTGGDKLNRYVPKDYILYNNYGPTENTVVTTSYCVDRQRENIPVGMPVSNVSVFVMACGTTMLQPDGVPGEICIGGQGLSRGYLNRPQLTIEKFVQLSDPDGSPESIRLYRSGDLGRRLENRHIEFLGRIDHQVKIRGLRIELGEIENRLLRIAGVAAACVTVFEAPEDNDKSIVAYIVPEEEEDVSPALLSGYLLEDLPRYMAPTHFVSLDELPLTPNGKVDRKALPAPGKNKTNPGVVKPNTETEAKVRAIWAELLGKDEHTLGVTDNFFELGGHSLKATGLASRFRQHMQVEFPLKAVFDHPNIRQMAALIDLQVKSVIERIRPTEKKAYYPQSSAQKRLFFLEQFDTTGTSYNVPDVYRLKGRLDEQMLREAFYRLTVRHESLRTSFALVDDEPVQIVNPGANLDIQHLDWRENNESLDDFLKGFIRPFDLSAAPLLRVTLVREGEDGWLLALDMHHIIGDGSTMGILIEDFIRLYKGERLPALKIQYRDYAVWQHQLHHTGALKRQLDYWRSRFEGDIPRLELPLDFPRPAVFDFAGSTFAWSLEQEECQELQDMLRLEGSTLYMGMLSVLATTLSHWSGQEDIVVGSGVANRRHTDLERIAGMMVNSLPLRVQPRGDLFFREFLKQVRTTSLEAFENQDVQFEELVEQLDPTRDPSRNPIFDVLFVVQNFERSRLVMPGMLIEPVLLDNTTSKFDITLYCLEGENNIHFVFEYCTSLFTEATIRNLASHVTQALRQFSANPRLRLRDLELLSTHGEQKKLPEFFKKTKGARPHDLAARSQNRQIPLDMNIDGENDESLRRMAALFAAVLGCRAEDVATDDDFFKIGGHSLKAMALVSRIHKEMGIQVPISVVFSAPTVRELALFIRNRRNDAISRVRPVERREYYPLSSAQKRMYILQRMMPGGVAYNMPAVFRLKGEELDLDSIESVFKALIERHESLRTSFELVDDEPVQRVWPRVDFHIRELDVEEGSQVEDVIDSFVRPFDLACPPLARAGVVKASAKEWYLVMDMHHIIGDGVSLQVLRREFFQLACGEQLPPLRVQYKDIAAWQHCYDYQHQLRTQRQYWLRQLSGPLPALALPYDFPRPAIQDFKGSSIGFVLGNEERSTLQRLEEGLDMTLFMSLSASFHLLLWILGGQEDIVTGFPVAGRRYADTQRVVGMFVNSLALRSHPSPQTTIEEFLIQIKKQTIAAFDNQDVPFEELVEQLELRRDASRNPVFDVMLALQNMSGEVELRTIPGPEEEGQVNYRNRASRFDMTWNALETNGRVYFEIEYCTALFSEKTMRQFAAYYMEVVRVMANNSRLRLFELHEMAVKKQWNILGPESHHRETSRNIEEQPPPGRSLSGEVEHKLGEIWAAVLAKEIESLTANDDFFSLGGHSLKAVKLTNAIFKTFGVEVGVQKIFQVPTIAGQAAIITRLKPTDFKEIPLIPPQNEYALSYSQKRIWLLQRLIPESTVFNMPMMVNLPEGNGGSCFVRQALQKLTLRHEAFRTSFVEKGEEIVQIIAEAVDIPLKEVDLSMLSSEDQRQAAEQLMQKESRTPFRLQEAPLFRATLIEFGGGKSALLINMHHIVSDGWSMQVLQQEFFHIHQRLQRGEGEALAPLRIQYKDFAAWQNRLLEDPNKLETALEFWGQYLAGDLPVLDLPYDFPENRHRTTASSGYRMVLEGETRTALQEIARLHEASLFMVLLAGFQMTLSFTRGGDDIVLGIPGAARQHDDLKQIIGLFVNTLIVRGQFDGALRFEEFLQTLRDNVFQVLDHQSIPLELIFEKLGFQYPKLTVFFNMVNIGATELVSLGDSIEPSHQENVQDTKFPLTLYLSNCKEGLDITCHYFNELFLPKTIQSILDLYLHVLRGIAKNPAQVLKDYRRQPKKRLTKKRFKQE